MPILGPFTQAKVIVNGVDLMTAVRGVHITDNRTPRDVSAMGSNYVQETKGLGEASIVIDFLQDFSAARVHATLQPLVGSTTPVVVDVIPDNTQAISATNPRIRLAAALLFTYMPLDGSIGDAAEFSAEFRNAPSGTGITYLTS